MAICMRSSKAVLRINEGLDLGSVRPLTPVVEADQEVIQRAAQLIQDTKPDSFDQRRSR